MSGLTRRLALASFCLLLLSSATQLHAQGTSVSPSNVNFGNQLVGTTSSAQTVTVTNTGTTSVTITSVTAPSPFSAGTACNSKKLAPNATCSFNVTFKPTAPGLATGTLTVAFAAPIASQSVSLSGTGIEPIATVSATSLSFGNEQVGTTSTAQPVTLSNTGNASLRVNGISINGTNPGNFAQTNTCGPFPATLAINASCTITVTFTPNTTGTRSADLAINVAKPATNQSVALSGVGVAQSASLNPTTLSFGNQAVGTTSAAQVVTLSNTGIGPLSISSIGIGGMNPGSFAQTNTCGNTLAVNGSCPISVTFKPTSTGSKSAVLQVHDAAGTQTTSLSGTGTTSGGVPPAFTSASSTTFAVGVSGSFTVTATGTPTPTLTESGALPAGVTFAATTGVLSGTPSTAGTFLITFTATNTAGTATQSFTLTVNKGTATVTLSNLTQTYTGNPIMPTATTTPAGLAISWTGAPDTNAGTYSVTATVNDPNYSGSANGSFVINKAAATVALSNLTQTYTGTALSPTVTTSPANLATTLTGAPDTNAGTYPVTAIVNDPNYSGSANGSFVIGQASPVFSNLTPSQTITYGTSSIALSGTLAAGSVYPPSGETVSITIASSTASPPIGGSGALSTNFMTGSIAASSTPYVITYRYPGDANFTPATDTSTTLTVNQAAATLQSIAVTPANPIIWPEGQGATQQFTATGTYSDNSTHDMTNTATWTSSNTSVATISGTGLATTSGVGSSTIQASENNISGSTTLTVVDAGFTNGATLDVVGHAATQLNNGLVLIAGGNDTVFLSHQPVNPQLYDPASASFTPTGAMNTPRSGATATLLNSGTVLIVGGADSNANLIASAEVYDPGTQTFANTGALNVPRTDHTATLLNNGTVLITGGSPAGYGSTTNIAEIYDPRAGTFTEVASPMTAARRSHRATLLNNGTVLIVGGQDVNFNNLNSAEVYDPVAGTFTAVGNMTDGRSYPTTTLLNDGTVLVAGGASNAAQLASAEIYTPTTSTFSSTPGSMANPHYLHTATLLNNGTVLIAGGCCATGSAELYDPNSGAFTPTGSLNTARYNFTSTRLNNGNVLVVGGYGNNAGATTSELYHPSTQTPPNLSSISLAPANPIIAVGEAMRFIATGTFNDSSSHQLASAVWSSTDATGTNVAQISNDATNSGVALGQSRGTATITACAGTICGSTALTVGVLNYTQLTPSTEPTNGYGGCCFAMAFDPVSNSTLLFGGVQCCYSTLGNTWQLQGGQWSQLFPNNAPSAREGPAMAFDAATNTVVLFGGSTTLFGGCCGDLNDTWIWNGATSTWTQVIANRDPNSPPARRFDGQGMAYDPNTKTVVMFGGSTQEGTNPTDTWTWNGVTQTWSQQSPATSPPQGGGGMATDPAGNVVLFNGPSSTTWVWNGTTWQQQFPATTPSAPSAGMAYDTDLNEDILYGGTGSNETWTWDGTEWTQIFPANVPHDRYAYPMEYDGAAHAVVLFGGFSSGPALNDTWELGLVP
jgi:hypothetical protein